MIDQIVRALKGVIPDGTWDFIFDQFKPHEVKFGQPSYTAVRVSKDYMLVKVEQQEKP
jgi:hypothetical protein